GVGSRCGRSYRVLRSRGIQKTRAITRRCRGSGRVSVTERVLLNQPQPERAPHQREKSEWKADAEVIVKTNMNTFAGRTFHDDDVCDGTRDREVAGERRGHGQREPAGVRVGKAGYHGP